MDNTITYIIYFLIGLFGLIIILREIYRKIKQNELILLQELVKAELKDLSPSYFPNPKKILSIDLSGNDKNIIEIGNLITSMLSSIEYHLKDKSRNRILIKQDLLIGEIKNIYVNFFEYTVEFLTSILNRNYIYLFYVVNKNNTQIPFMNENYMITGFLDKFKIGNITFYYDNQDIFIKFLRELVNKNDTIDGITKAKMINDINEKIVGTAKYLSIDKTG